MLVFSPVGHPVAFFSEKLSEAKEKILHIRQGVICDGTSSMLLEALSYFKEFVLSSDREALKHLNNQKKLKSRHGKWIEFLQVHALSSMTT